MNASHNKNIVLIDDDPISIFISTSMLQNPEFNIISYENAVDALDHLRQWSAWNAGPFPEIIFLDINMPMMDGWEFLNEYSRVLDNATNRPVIVMLTSSINPQDIKQARKFGQVSDFKSKPLTLETIQAILNKHFQ